MKRAAVFLLILMWAGGAAEAASGDADGTYTVTVTKIEISKDGGSTYLAVFEGSSAINIAAANAGAVAAGLVSGSGVPPGTYDTVRTTIGDTLQIKGYVNNGATTLFTNNDADGFGLNAAAADTAGGGYTTSSFAIPAGNRTSTQSVSIVCSDGGPAGKVRVAFDTSGVITQAGGIPSIGAPVVTISSG